MPEQRVWRRTVAFSGSRRPTRGMQSDAAAFVDALDSNTRVVVGGCLGIDALVARLAYRRGLWVHAVIPANRTVVDPEWREFCDTKEECPPDTDYGYRDARMVELCDELIALPLWPEHHPESGRSGTWKTIRIAWRLGKPVTIRPPEEQHDRPARTRSGGPRVREPDGRSIPR